MTTTFVDHVTIRHSGDIDAIEAVPLEDRMPAGTTYELIARVAHAQPEHTAIYWLPSGVASDTDRAYSYQEFLARITQTANWLRGTGLGRKDVIAYLLPNLPETHFAFAGGQAACIVMPLNPLLEADHLASMLNAAGARLLLAARGGDFEFLASKAASVAERVPGLQVVHIDTEQQRDDSFLSLLDGYAGDRLEFEYDAKPSDYATYLHTGGTTGTPKIARSTHWAEVTQGWLAGALTHLTPADVTVAGLPLFHATALRINGIAVWASGSSLVLLGPIGYRNPAAVQSLWATIERYRVTSMMAVATVYSALVQIPVESCNVSSLRFAACGAAPLPVELAEQFEARFGLALCEGYGLTEGCCLSSMNPPFGPRKTGTIGLRVPYQEMKVAALDDDGGYVRDCDVDEVGVLLLRGPNMTDGYLCDTAELFVDGSWINTGDLARQDADGYFVLAGRRKDLIIRSGHNIDPVLIEQALLNHPEVEAALAVGMPDIYAGELPVVFVKLTPNACSSAAELHVWAARHITERPAAPKRLFLIDEVPTTAVGKHTKVPLRWVATEAAIVEAVNTQLAPATLIRAQARTDTRHALHVDIVLKVPHGTDPAVTHEAASRLFRSFNFTHTLRIEAEQ